MRGKRKVRGGRPGRRNPRKTCCTLTCGLAYNNSCKGGPAPLPGGCRRVVRLPESVKSNGMLRPMGPYWVKIQNLGYGKENQMTLRKHVMIGLCAVVSLCVVALLVEGCKKEEKAKPVPTTKPAAKVVNSRCPMLDTDIDRAKVADDLIVEYKGKKLGLCCAGCKAKWDKLTDAQKDEGLAKVLPAEKK